MVSDGFKSYCDTQEISCFSPDGVSHLCPSEQILLFVSPKEGVQCFDPGGPWMGKVSNDIGHGSVLFCSFGSDIGLLKGIRFSLWGSREKKKLSQLRGENQRNG